MIWCCDSKTEIFADQMLLMFQEHSEWFKYAALTAILLQHRPFPLQDYKYSYESVVPFLFTRTSNSALLGLNMVKAKQKLISFPTDQILRK